MRWLRIVFYVVVGFALLGGLIVGAVFYFTQGAVTAADEFFATIVSSGAAAAYHQASPAFQASSSEAGFSAQADKLGLTRFTSASWPSRSMTGGQTELTGTLTLSDGNALPVTIKLVKAADGSWRVFSLNIPDAGVNLGNTKP